MGDLERDDFLSYLQQGQQHVTLTSNADPLHGLFKFAKVHRPRVVNVEERECLFQNLIKLLFCGLCGPHVKCTPVAHSITPTPLSTWETWGTNADTGLML